MLEHMHQKFQNGREETLLEADVHAHMQPRKKNSGFINFSITLGAKHSHR
jgi:hypothetical protein